MDSFSPQSAYLPRVADEVLTRKLKVAGAVQIQGPKWCGKTATAQQAAASAIYMQDPDNSADYLQLAFSKPSLLLEGDTPRLIDEWQMAPQLWDAVRYAIDREHGRGRFILTGSSTPRLSETPAHSGVGRFARITMRTMSLWEARESTGAVSLADLFAGRHNIGALVDFDIERIAFAICRGGWPEAVTEKDDASALEMAKEYVKMGYYIGVGGVVTFKNSRVLKEVVKAIPLECIVVETDCPYLAPAPHRGKRNSSAYLPLVIEEIARLKEITAEEVENVTYENAQRLYGLIH